MHEYTCEDLLRPHVQEALLDELQYVCVSTFSLAYRSEKLTTAKERVPARVGSTTTNKIGRIRKSAGA